MPEQIQRTFPIIQTSWQSGMITSLPPEELPNDAAQDILNCEFDVDSNLVARVGVQLYNQPDTNGARITSMFRAQYSNGTVIILITFGTKLFKCNEDGSSLTDITGALTFPSNTIWQWVMFNDFAIGVNKATSGTNPVKVSNAGTPTLLANAPFAKYVETWNSRLWLVGTGVNQNTVFASAINAHEDWTVDDDAGAITLTIDQNDGDFITGIKAFRGSLFPFKRRKINIISPIAAPATIPGNLRVDVFTKNLGMVSPYSLQTVLDDIVFNSESGPASLSQSEFGELKSALLGQNVAELSTLKKTAQIEDVTSLVLDDVNQYWLSIPASISPRGINEIYVMDYQKIKTSGVRWVRYNGLIAGTAFAEKLDGNFKSYLIAAQPIGSADTKIYTYTPSTTAKVFNDEGTAYIKSFKTKAYIGQSPLLRSLWLRFGGSLKLITNFLGLTINYFFNNSTSAAGTFGYNFVRTTTGSIYGVALYGTGVYTDKDNFFKEETIWQRFKQGSFGRKAKTITVEVSSSNKDEAFVFKFLQFDYAPLTRKRAKTIGF